MGATPSFNLRPGSPSGIMSTGLTSPSFDLTRSSPDFSFPTNPAPASPSPNFPVIDPNPAQGGRGQVPYTQDVGGGYRSGSTINPNFTGNVMSFLTDSLLRGGANPYTGQLSADPSQNPLLAQLAQLYQGRGSSLPGAGNLQNIAGGMGPGILNQLAEGLGLGSIPGMAGGQGFGSLNQLAMGQGPGMGSLSQLSQSGAPIDQTPAWQAMVDAMQRQIGQGATNLKEQFNFAGGLMGTPFANSIQDYYNQSSKDLNAQLLGAQTGALENAANRRLGASQVLSNTALSGSDILSQLGLGASNTLQNSALNSALGLGGLSSNVGMGLLNSAGNMGQYTQSLADTALGRQYQDWIRQQPQYNPLLPMLQQMATTFPPFLNTNQGQSPLNALIGSLPSLINAVHPASLNFNPTYSPTVTASGGAGGQGGTATAQGGSSTSTSTANPTVSPIIDPSMNPTFQNVPTFNVSPTFNPTISPQMINSMGGLPNLPGGGISPIGPPPSVGSLPPSGIPPGFPWPPQPSPPPSTGTRIGFPGGPMGPTGPGSAPPPPPGGYGNMPTLPGPMLDPNFGPGTSWGFPYDPGPPSVGNFPYPAGGLPGFGPGLEGTPSTNPALNPNAWGDPYQPLGPSQPTTGYDPGVNYNPEPDPFGPGGAYGATDPFGYNDPYGWNGGSGWNGWGGGWGWGGGGADSLNADNRSIFDMLGI